MKRQSVNHVDINRNLKSGWITVTSITDKGLGYMIYPHVSDLPANSRLNTYSCLCK